MFHGQMSGGGSGGGGGIPTSNELCKKGAGGGAVGVGARLAEQKYFSRISIC